MYPFGLSFIIPAYNEAKSIGAAISSIDYVMRNKNIPFEIIVADNDSDDATSAIAHACGATTIFVQQKGVVFARDAATRIAKYSHLVNIDADCAITEEWFKAMHENLGNNELMAFSGPLCYDNVSPFFQILTDSFYQIARLFHKVAPTLQGGNYVLRHDIFDSMSGYDTSYEFWGEDTRTAQKVSYFGKILLDPKMKIMSSSRRIKNQGLFSTVSKYIVNYLSVYLLRRPIHQKYKDYR